MAKKHDEEEHAGNHERWLLTYSDLITLLMIFFIVMYSMSAMDNNKFTAVAQQLGVVFGGGSGRVIGIDAAGLSDLLENLPYESIDELEGVRRNIEQYIEDSGLQGSASIYRNERGLVVSLSEGLLFESGAAHLDQYSGEILDKIGDAIIKLPNYVRVEGFTDNIPIKNAQFSSNWELASQRAINVAKILIDKGFEPHRMATVSYGEYRPLRPNDTAENRR